MKILPSFLLLMLSVGTTFDGSLTFAQTTPPTDRSSPLLAQLNDEVQKIYSDTADGIVRVRVPTRWLNPTAQWLKKWEGKMTPEMRERFLEQQRQASQQSKTDLRSDSPSATTGPSTNPTNIPTTNPAALLSAFLPETTDVAGLLIDDAGHVLLAGAVDAGQMNDDTIVRVMSRDGATREAVLVGTDSLSGLTILRMKTPPKDANARAMGQPLTFTDKRPAEGSVLVLLYANEARLIVYTPAMRDSGIVALPNGSVGLMREGRFIGGPGLSQLLTDLRERGHACRPQLGLEILEINSTPDTMRLARPYDVGRSALVAHQVFDNHPAADAGVLAGDLLIALDGHGVPDMCTLASVLTQLKGSVVLTVGRGARQIDIKLQLPDPRADAKK